ncbi:hypothetical protein [Crucivirus-359]|nr:hypothetical protein [Crucivirus-359]
MSESKIDEIIDFELRCAELHLMYITREIKRDRSYVLKMISYDKFRELCVLIDRVQNNKHNEPECHKCGKVHNNKRNEPEMESIDDKKCIECNEYHFFKYDDGTIKRYINCGGRDD